jgi:hypothetical protein
MAPILIGLSAPVIVYSMTSAASGAHVRFLLIALMSALLVVATVMFAASLLLEGNLTSIEIDETRHCVDLIYTSALSTRRKSIPFEAIAALRLTFQYDDDGYRYAAPELVLRDGDRQLLPLAMDEQEIRAIRSTIGLVT